MFFNLEYKLLFFGIFISIIVSTIFIIISYFLIKREPFIEKNSAYECGFQPFADSRIPFDIHFYLVSLLFLIFDLEILFLIPWTAVACYMNFFGYKMLLIFLFILTLGFFYEWKKGALDW